MRLIAIDPGIRGCGVALFWCGLLDEAHYIVNPVKKGNQASAAFAMADTVYAWVRNLGIDALAVEWPRIYATRIREGKTKEDPNDLLALAAVDAAIAALMKVNTYSYYPSEWKGQMDKNVCHAYIHRRLTEDETAAAEIGAAAAKSKAHNMWDAVGIGLFHLGRMERKRVIPA